MKAGEEKKIKWYPKKKRRHVPLQGERHTMQNASIGEKEVTTKNGRANFTSNDEASREKMKGGRHQTGHKGLAQVRYPIIN